MREREMDEVDEERDGELELELEAGGGGGGVNVGTRLYLVHACRCCLVTGRKQIEGRELESTSPFIFLARSLFCSWPYTLPKIPTQARTHHTNKDTLSVSFSLRRCHTHTHTHREKSPVPH